MALTKVTGHVIKSDTNITSHNINSSGIITAISFDGNVSGVAVTFTGDSTIGSLGITTNLNVGGISTFTGNIDANGDIDVDGHTNLDNVSIAGVTTFSDNIDLPTDKKILLGDNDKFTIYKSSSPAHAVIENEYSSGSYLYVGSANGIILGSPLSHNQSMIRGYVNGRSELYFSGSKKFETTNTGASVTGNLAVSGNMNVEGVLTYQDVTNIDSIGIVTARAGIVVQDDATFQTANGGNIFIDKSDNSIRLGQSVGLFYGTNKMWMQHNGSVGYLHNVTGSLYIRNDDSSGDIYIQGKSGEHSIICNYDGNVQLYNDGTIRFNTTATGVTVHGSADPDLKIRQGASSSSGSGFLAFENVDGNGQPRSIAKIQGKTTGNGGYGELNFQTQFNNTLSTRWTIDNTGHLVPGTAGAVNIGSASKEIGNVYLGDDKRLFFGSDQDFSIKHSGTNAFIDNDTGNLNIQSDTTYISNKSGGSIFAEFTNGGASKLRYAGGEKLATSDTGITVTGEVAASQDYPTFRPTLDLNFAAEKKLDPRIEYSRTGPASYYDEFGKLIIVGDNTPRFDHNPDTGECKGLLIEESRTNLQPHSEQHSPDAADGFINISSNMTVDYDPGVVTPTGETTGAITFVETGGSGQHYLGLDHYGAVTSGQTYTFSFFIKNISGSDTDHVKVITTTAAFPYIIRTFYFAGTNAGTTNSPSDSTMTKLPNGWWRCSITVTTNNNFSQTAFSIDYRGYGSGSPYDNVVALWGIQAELGAFPTSYIRTGNATSGETQTRGYEAVTLEGTDFSDVFGTEFKEFSLVADYDNTQTNDGTSYGIVDLWGEATNYNDRIEWFKDDVSPYHIETRAFGQGNPTFANGNLSASSKAKAQRFATSWYVPDYSNTSSRRFVVSMGGEAVDVISDSSGTTIPQITRMGIGCNPTRLDFSPGLLHFKRLMVYNKTLSDGQLQNLSAQ